MKWREYIHGFEWHLLLTAVVLSALGISFIWSSSLDTAHLLNKPIRQATYLLACFPLVLVLLRLGYPMFIRSAYGIYFLLLFLLVLVLFIGRGGAARWFDVAFGLKFQPSEFMKIGLVLVLSRYLMYPRDLTTWKALIRPFLLTAVPMVLIIRQPDLGTAIVLLPVLFGMLYVAGVPAKRLAIIVLIGAVSLPVVYHLPVLKDYQRDRVTSFIQSIPRLDARARELKKEGKLEEAYKIESRIRQLKRGSGFQQFYSMVSIGSGGMTGKGLAKGPQNRMGRIPARHTDFIFAVVGEEWGILGCSAMLLLFFMMVSIINGVARRTREPFGRYLCTGVVMLFTTQIIVNTGISVGLLPITGLTLPFVSYGGSSLMSSYLSLALVLDVGVRRVVAFGPHL